MCVYICVCKKYTRVPVLSHQTTRVKTFFFNEGGLMTENSNESGFLFIMNLKIKNTFLVPTFTYETTINIDVLCLEIQNNGRCVSKYHIDAVKHCAQITN